MEDAIERYNANVTKFNDVPLMEAFMWHSHIHEIQYFSSFAYVNPKNGQRFNTSFADDLVNYKMRVKSEPKQEIKKKPWWRW